MKKVLFLCTGNSCRSQMAEALLRHLSGGKVEAVSAGIDPTEVNPLSVKVMDEIGIDISGQRAKNVDGFASERFDYVITLCDSAMESCPVFPGEYKKKHWCLPDPASAQGTEEEKLAIFRNVRDQIKKCVIKFLENRGSARKCSKINGFRALSLF